MKKNKSSKSAPNVLCRVSEGVAVVKINRPEKMNALNKQTLEDLAEVFAKLEGRAGLKGVIITGTGDKAFVAGADIAELNALSPEEATLLSARVQGLFRKIETFRVPVIAAVNGFALGGGCELAMACHMRFASTNAMFGQPEVKLGLIPGYAGTQRLPGLIGRGLALEYLLSGDMIRAQRAEAIGLVNRLVEQKDLLATAKKFLYKISSMGPLAISATIDLVDAAYDPARNGALEEQQMFGALFKTADYREGTAAFLEKRKANFKGK